MTQTAALKQIFGLLRWLTIALLAVFTSGAAMAQDITVAVGFGRIVNLSQPASSVFVGTDELVSVQAVTPTAVYVSGLAPGFTNLIAMNDDEEVILSRRVNIVPESEETSAVMSQLIPLGSITVKRIGSTDILIGQARTIEDAQAVVALRQGLEADGRRVLDETSVTTPYQIGVRVRIVELQREQIQRLGFDLTAYDQTAPFRVLTGGGVAADFLQGASGIGTSAVRAGVGGSRGDLDVNMVLDVLEARGLVQILSEPVLTTVSGRKATFSAGSEFASPVNQGDGIITNEYRRSGISIDLLPTALPNGRISLEINPKMSYVDNSVGSDVNGTPTLQVRETNTTVEVGSGQTFAIAGLHQQFSEVNEVGLPGVMRRFFTNRETRKNAQEVIFFVTPYFSDGATTHEPERHVSVHDTIGFIFK